MKRTFFILIIILFTAPIIAQEVTDKPIKRVSTQKKINFGVKGGFTSTIYLTSSFILNGIDINHIQNNYKIGYHTSFFLRLNLGNHYIQPEISYYINRGEIEFNKNGGQITDNNEDHSLIKSKLQSIDIPLLYGYNFIKQDIYGMSFYIGPKLKINLSNKQDIQYKNFDITNIEEKLYPINIGLTLGLSVYISKIFFDFRYDQVLHNISKNITYTLPDNMNTYKGLKLHRRDNMLSFSLGVIL